MAGMLMGMRSHTLLFGVGVASLASMLSGCASGPQVPRTATIAGAPAGTYIDPEIAAGYARYKEPLDRFGTWYADTHYGVRWCPRDVEATFSAYHSRGHWRGAEGNPEGVPEGVPEGAVPNVPPSSSDSPYWVSDDAETWGDITMHHGYWVKNDWGRSCWIPGTEETPARVVWRSGNGYVGWAAEPPNWVDDTDDAGAVLLDWTFVLLGALFQPHLHEQCLCAEETREAAVHATRPIVGDASRKNARRGPQQAEVSAAENALRAHVAANPTVDPKPAAPTVASNDSASSSSASSGNGSKKKSTTSDASSTTSMVRVAIVPLPPGEEMFLRLRRYPFQGPSGLAPTGTALRAPPRLETGEAPHTYAGAPSSGGDSGGGSTNGGAAGSTRSASGRDASASSSASSRGIPTNASRTSTPTSSGSSGSSSTSRSSSSSVYGSNRASSSSTSSSKSSTSSSSSSSSSSRSSSPRRK